MTVALSGDGGDELFAGYNRHASLARLWRLAGPVPYPLRRALGGAMRRLPPGAVDALALTLPSRWQVRLPSTKVEKLGRVLEARNPQNAYDMLRSSWTDPSTVVLGTATRSGPTHVDRSKPNWATSDIMDALLRSDLTTYLPDDVLTKVDRAAMAVSLETRAPFLDRAVLDVAWRLPQSSKLRDGTSKWMLRQVLHRHVPASLVDRPKMGFGAPMADWLRGPLRPWAEELLTSASLRRHGLLDPVPRPPRLAAPPGSSTATSANSCGAYSSCRSGWGAGGRQRTELSSGSAPVQGVRADRFADGPRLRGRRLHPLRQRGQVVRSTGLAGAQQVRPVRQGVSLLDPDRLVGWLLVRGIVIGLNPMVSDQLRRLPVGKPAAPRDDRTGP